MVRDADDRAERAVLAVLARNRGEVDASVLTRLLGRERVAAYDRAGASPTPSRPPIAPAEAPAKLV